MEHYSQSCWPYGVCESKVPVAALSPKPHILDPHFSNFEYTCSHFSLFNLKPATFVYRRSVFFLTHTTWGWSSLSTREDAPPSNHVHVSLHTIINSFLSFYAVGQAFSSQILPWSDDTSSIHLNILPPFHSTTHFYWCYTKFILNTIFIPWVLLWYIIMTDLQNYQKRGSLIAYI